VAGTAVYIGRLPQLGTEFRSDVAELKGQHWTVPGDSGIWIRYPVESEFTGKSGGGAGITWMAREGFVPARCRMGCDFNACWGKPLSTIEGGNWHVSKEHYEMTGQIYYHYGLVPKGTRGSVVYQGQAYRKDAATCAGDYAPALRNQNHA
jgi:hypothetical protein